MRLDYIEKLASLAAENGMDAVLVCPSEELRFLTGFSPSMCERFQALFITKAAELFYVTNLLYAGEIRNAYPDIKIYTWFDGDFMPEKIKEAFAAESLLNKTIGVNSTAEAFNTIEIAKTTGVKFVNAKPLLEEMRIIKSGEELANLRKAAEIADKTYGEVIRFIKPGMKEADINDFLAAQMQKNGGSNPWSIVASGPNSSYPHYHGRDRVIEDQDIIILDFGCTYNGMFSDTSRTVFVGGITPEQKEIYEIVRESNEAGEKAAVDGAFIPDVDKAARDIIDKTGHKEHFINRLGHGIGFMIHEAPDIKASNPRKLEKGMCFSVEPGIYMAGKYGMRIEDIVAITDNGTEILNKTTHDIVIIK